MGLSSVPPVTNPSRSARAWYAVTLAVANTAVGLAAVAPVLLTVSVLAYLGDRPAPLPLNRGVVAFAVPAVVFAALVVGVTFHAVNTALARRRPDDLPAAVMWPAAVVLLLAPSAGYLLRFA